MNFPWRKQCATSDSDEALAAKIDAEIKQKQALKALHYARQQSQQLAKINEKNHFTDAIRRAMGGAA